MWSLRRTVLCMNIVFTASYYIYSWVYFQIHRSILEIPLCGVQEKWDSCAMSGFVFVPLLPGPIINQLRCVRKHIYQCMHISLAYIWAQTYRVFCFIYQKIASKLKLLVLLSIPLQVPLYVATKMVSSITKPSFFIPSADGYAEAALRWIGYEARCTPYWPHSLQCSLLHFLPDSAVDAWRLKVCLGIRKRGQLNDLIKQE